MIVWQTGLTVRDSSSPGGGIGIEIAGLRPRGKLLEELLIGNNPLPTAHPRIMKPTEHGLPWSELRRQLDRLGRFIEEGDVAEARAVAGNRFVADGCGEKRLSSNSNQTDQLRKQSELMSEPPHVPLPRTEQHL